MALVSSRLAKPAKKIKGRRRTAGRPTSDELEIRKSRILEVATELFIQYGFAETALVDVAKHAGVATRTIYQHFGDKADVFRAVIETREEETEHELPVFNAELSVFDTVLATAHYVCALAFSGTAIPFQRLMLAEGHRFPDLMRQIFDDMYRRLHGNVAEVFETLAKAGKIPHGDHHESTKFFIDLLLGTAPMQLNMNWIKSGPSEAELRKKVSLFIVGRFGISDKS
jgi:TetR/AcrR family transcriptional regulator, mexJK operon transcriptional repressor